VLNMEVTDFIKVLAKGSEREQEERAYLTWITWKPHDSKNTTWEEFKNGIMQKEPIASNPNEEQRGLYVDQCFF
jgi:inhibitor of KinA sporulation pathway (predicted exonuclease)